MGTATQRQLELIIDAPAPGEENMRRDVELLDACARGDIPGAVRLYGFEPACLSLGRMQPVDDVDLDACFRDGVDIVRRPSGGRAVLHDQEVTYAVVCRATDPVFGGRVLQSCSRIHQAISRGLEMLGVHAIPRAMPANLRRDAREGATVADCFARPAAHELLDDRGRKLVGSAQARRAGALLQHGSVLLEPPHAAAYLRGSAVETLGGVGVRELLGRPVSRAELLAALAAGFREALEQLPPPLNTTA
ncbi:MAG: biotin/lipoate A/B protein ligase family protein [Candidatus Dormibacteria bacterium]